MFSIQIALSLLARRPFTAYRAIKEIGLLGRPALLATGLALASFASNTVHASEAATKPTEQTDNTLSAEHAAELSVFQARWQLVLNQWVDRHGKIDFASIPSEGVEYLREFIAEFPHQRLNADEQFAYHLNAYNILCLIGIIDHDIPERLDDGLLDQFFKQDTYEIGGQAMSLSVYENEVIRAFPDPRLHVALNCMSASCPPLFPEVFTSSQLERQLSTAMRQFANDSQHITYDAGNHQVHASKILEWYRVDFPGKDDRALIAYLNTFRDSPLPLDASIRWRPYDWTVIRRR